MRVDSNGIVKLTQEELWASLVAEVSARFRHMLVIWGRHLEEIKVRGDFGGCLYAKNTWVTRRDGLSALSSPCVAYFEGEPR